MLYFDCKDLKVAVVSNVVMPIVNCRTIQTNLCGCENVMK